VVCQEREKGQNYGTFLLGRIDTMQNEAGDRREDACPAKEEENETRGQLYELLQAIAV
jgi:uncharacterized membrane protein YgaE (UPF0421/DUF939 family)